MDAVRSVDEIHSGSRLAQSLVDEKWGELEAYVLAMQGYLTGAAEARGMAGIPLPSPTSQEMEAMNLVPGLAPGIRAVETSLGRWVPMQEYLTANPTALPDLGLSRNQATQIQNFVNGKRSITEILYWVRGVTGEPLTLEQVEGYLGILAEVSWITLQGG